MLTEGENKKKKGIDVSSETKTVAISTKHLSSTCHCHCTGSKGRRSNYLQLPISKKRHWENEREMSCFEERKLEIKIFQIKIETEKLKQMRKDGNQE